MKLFSNCIYAFSAFLYCVLISGCGGAAGFPDGRVDAFSFEPATGIAVNTTTVSNPVTVSGIDIEVAISITGSQALNPAYSIDNGEFTANPGKVSDGSQVRVRILSATEMATKTEAVLTIGDRSVVFSVSTIGSQLPELISSITATDMQISAGGDGSAFAVFVDNDSIYANRFDGLAWQTAVEVDAGDTVALTPYVGADANGNAVAIWAQDDGQGENTVYANYYELGAGWGRPTEIVSAPGGSESPHLAVNSSGQAAAVWTQFIATPEGAFPASTVASIFNGDAWSTSTPIENTDDDMTNYSIPRVAIDENGNVAATWQGMDSAGNDGHIYVNKFAVSEGWGSHTLLGGAGESFTPQITLLSSGEALAVWEQFGDDNLVYSSMTPANANSWGTASPIGDTADTRYPNQTRLARDGQGNALVVYLKNGNVLYSTRYHAGTGWENTALELDTTPVEFANEATALAMDTAGNALVVYESDNDIAMLAYDVTQGIWSEPEIVDQATEGAFDPRIGVGNTEGNFFYAWEQGGIIAFQYVVD